jgi:hypothetical protein
VCSVDFIAYVGKVWGNGEVGLSRERGYALHRTTHVCSESDREWNAAMLSVHGVEKFLEYRRGLPGAIAPGGDSHEGVVQEEREGRSPIGSSLVANSHRCRRGQSGISKYGGKLVRNAAYALQQSVARERLTFATLTLPNVSVEESYEITEDWSEVCRVFTQRLRRALRRNRLPGEIVGVTEVQEKRMALTGIFGLHLHLVFVGRRKNHGWAITPKEIKEMWKSALSRHLVNPLDFYDWRACENLQPVRKDASSYLGKYLSKGLKSCQRIKAIAPGVHLPTSWYVCTVSLRKEVKKKTLRVSGWMGAVLADILASREEEFVAYSSTVCIDVGGGQLPIGFVGRLTPVGRSQFELVVRAQREGDSYSQFVEAFVE